jgi:hypothetical protein
VAHVFAQTTRDYRQPIRVLGVYEDALWLGTDRNAWPVAYHGTATANIFSILRNGFIAGGSNDIPVANGAAHGRGIYLSPNPEYSSSRRFARSLLVDGRQYQIMFQVRIKPSAIHKRDLNIWTCGNSKDVRPYRILFKET